MKKIMLLVVFSVFILGNTKAQFQELNAGVGFSYYYGDLNIANTSQSIALFGDFFDAKNFKMSYSLGYRYNFEQRFSLGLNLYHMYVSGYDSDNKTTETSGSAYYRKIRNLSFHSTINEGFIDLRFEPFRTTKNWAKNKFHISPYVGGGIGLFMFNPKTFTNSGQEVELQPLGTEGQGIAGYADPYSLLQFTIPLNAGIRFTPKSRNFSLNLDFNYNHTFTDYIDDVSTTYADINDLQSAYQTTNPSVYALVSELYDRRATEFKSPDIRGKSNHDDFFMTGQVKFSYYFNKVSSEYYKCCDF